jgi:c(7)-type cytochrome triheme protein
MTRQWRSRFPGLLVVAALALWGTALAGQSMPKLPDGLPLAKSADSPGQVTFNHFTHVDEANPSCTSCHSSLFPILKSSPRPKYTHEVMGKGQLCGACHDGKKAFALDDDCSACHASE